MIKNQTLGRDLLQKSHIITENVEQLKILYGRADLSNFRKLATTVISQLSSIGTILLTMKDEIPLFENVNIGLAQNAIHSLHNICVLEKNSSGKVIGKLQFELLPILEELKTTVYVYCFVKGDLKKEKEFELKEMKRLCANSYIERGAKTNQYKYDVSIMVTAYNKLDITKQCIESILKYTPPDINYELILTNHGSVDGTKEYFESINATKQVDYKYNNLLSGATWNVWRILEGKYYCAISNDILVGPNYLTNMMRCMEADPDIKIVVPTTTHITNSQAIPFEFTTMSDMWDFAEKNNVYDPYRHEQRTRLVNPIEFGRTADIVSTSGIGKSPIHLRGVGFDDDIQSLLIRRSGGKSILAKDTFCYHFGSVTLKEEPGYNTMENVINRRNIIKEYYGIDPWGTGHCFDEYLFKCFECDNKGSVKVLGINCGLGSNPLKVKESTKENVHNLDCCVHNITDAKEYEFDLKGVSDNVNIISNQSELIKLLDGKKFDYIFFEDAFNFELEFDQIANLLYNATKNDGVLSISKRCGITESMNQILTPTNITKYFCVYKIEKEI